MMTVSPSILIPSKSAHLPSAMLSHRGRVRENNEDRLMLRSFRNQAGAQPVLLAVLADGVGGHHGGEVAAELGVQAITEVIASCSTLDDPPALIHSAIQAANRSIQAHTAAEPDVFGMGATCVCVLLIGERLYLGNLGDSRAYLFSQNGLTQLTHDHTMLEETSWSDLPGMRGSRRGNPFAHVLSRYLGSPDPPDVDLRVRLHAGESDQDMLKNQGMRLQSGEKVLLCSDGLSDMLSDKHILSILQGYRTQKALQKLVLCALENGGHDNVSAILIEIP